MDTGQGVDLEKPHGQELSRDYPRLREQALSEQRLGYWKSTVRLGLLLLVGESIAVLLYFRFEPNGLHRSVLTAIASFDAFVALGSFFLASRIATLTWFCEWVLGAAVYAGAALAVCIYLDGGLGSPLIFLMVRPLRVLRCSFLPGP